MGVGSPDSLISEQVANLEKVSSLVKKSLTFKIENEGIILEIIMPRQGTALITAER
jgi:hypothetical protein